MLFVSHDIDGFEAFADEVPQVVGHVKRRIGPRIDREAFQRLFLIISNT